MKGKTWSNVAIDYENNMKKGCFVVSYEESVIFQYIWGIRYSMYGGLM